MTSHHPRTPRAAFVAASLLAAFAVSGCEDSSGPSDNEAIPLGGLFSLTGNWASLGVTSKAALEIGIEDVNQYLAGGGTQTGVLRRFP